MGNPLGGLAGMLGPGGTAPALPGQDPANSSSQGASPGQQDQVRQIIAQILKSAQQGQKQLASPVTAPIPDQGNGQMPDYMKQQGWGFERFAHGLSGMIQKGVSEHKQNQLAKAESDWNQLATAMQSGNQQALNAILTDPKKLKLMAKALNQDWLNPEKTDVYKEALKKVMAQQQQKGQAAQGMMQMFKHLIGRATQPQLDDAQKQRMAQEIQGKAPVSQVGDPKALNQAAQSVAELQNSQANLQRAQSEARDKYQFITGADGSVTAVDKSDPHKTIPLTDESGKPISGQPKVGLQPKVVSIGGVPYGVSRGGKMLTPGDPEWTGADAKLFQAATGATAASNASKDHRIKLASESRAMAYMSSREYPVQDSDGNLVMVTPQQINSNPGKYSPAGAAVKAQQAQSIFGEMDYTFGQLKESIAGLDDKGFDASARVQIAAVLRDTDPRSALQSFLGSSVAETLTDAQVNFVTSQVAAVESAMSLRSVAGMGQGSDTVRNAIIRMLPGAGTPSKKFADKQMSLVVGELDALKKGIPGTSKNPNKPAAAQGGVPSGAVSIGTSKKDGKDHYLDASGKDLGAVK